MAYADLEFYKNSYFGNVVPDSEFRRLAEKASDFLDVITFDRLVDGLPQNERWKTKIKKAVCAVTEKMYQLELAEKQAISVATASGTAISTGTEMRTTGIIKSKSAGSESVSYASPSDLAGGAKAWSALYAKAGDEQAANRNLLDTALPYLYGIKTDKGELLLYAGCYC